MLLDGVLSHGPMCDPCLCSAQDARGCLWMGSSPTDALAIPACSAHKVLLDARGWGVLTWTHAQSLLVQLTNGR